MHVRQQIREAAGAALVAAATVAGVNVHESRVYPLQQSGLPAIKIYTTDEASEADERTMGASPKLLRKTLLIIEGVIKSSADVDDKMDALAVEIENVLAGNLFGGIIKDIMIAATSTDIDVLGDKPVGVVTINYEVLYFTSEADPETAL